REGLRAFAGGANAGDVRAADPRAWESTSGFRRSLGDCRRSEMQGTLLRHGVHADVRLLRSSLSSGDDGSVSGRTRARLCLFRGSAAADSLRQHEAGGGEDSGWRRAEEDAGILGTAEPLFV